MCGSDRASVPPLKFQRTTISTGHQITIPSVPFRAAGFEAGDRLQVTATGDGRAVIERIARPALAQVDRSEDGTGSATAGDVGQADGAAEATPSAEGRVG